MQLNLLGHHAPLNYGLEFSMHNSVSLVRSRPSHAGLLREHPCLGHFGYEPALIKCEASLWPLTLTDEND